MPVSKEQKNATNRRYTHGKTGVRTRKLYHKSSRGKQVAKKYHKSTRCKDTMRSWRLLQRYGITVAKYEGILAQQGGHCALCTRVPAKERWGVLCVDHDHAKAKGDPGFIRGLLCRRHNDAIHKLGDTAKGVALALAYMRGSTC